MERIASDVPKADIPVFQMSVIALQMPDPL
jgi:hypothetical protein